MALVPMALVLAAGSVMAWLGQPQLDRARENGDEQQQQQQQEQARSVTALDGVLRARQTSPGRGSTSRLPPPGSGTPPTNSWSPIAETPPRACLVDQGTGSQSQIRIAATSTVPRQMKSRLSSRVATARNSLSLLIARSATLRSL